jgi:opacity protein-like surface antigen
LTSLTTAAAAAAAATAAAAAAAAAADLRREFSRAEAQLAVSRADAMLRAVMAGAELGSYEPAVRSLNARHGEIGEIDWSLGGAGRREEPRASAVVSTTPSRSSLLQGGNFVWANKRLMVLD